MANLRQRNQTRHDFGNRILQQRLRPLLKRMTRKLNTICTVPNEVSGLAIQTPKLKDADSPIEPGARTSIAAFGLPKLLRC